MSHEIARELIEREIAILRLQCYADLVARMGKSEPKELLGCDGNRYRFAVQVFWDSKKGGDIRVMVGVGGEGISGRSVQSRLTSPWRLMERSWANLTYSDFRCYILPVTCPSSATSP